MEIIVKKNALIMLTGLNLGSFIKTQSNPIEYNFLTWKNKEGLIF